MDAIPGRAKPNVPGTPPPPAVEAAAAQRGLGELLDVRREGVVVRMVVGAVLLVVLGLVLLGVFTSLSRLPPGRLGLIRQTVILGMAVAVLAIGAGAALGVHGALGAWRGHYLFAGGMVHRFLTGTRVATWAEIDRFAPIRNRFGDGADGRVLGYRVEAGGRKVAAVPLLLVDGRDSFVDLAGARLATAGRPGAVAAGGAGVPVPDPVAEPSAVEAPAAADGPTDPPTDPPTEPTVPASYHEGVAAQREVVRAKAERGVVFGVLWIVLGLALTAYSYSIASGYGGSTYVFYWGIAAYGAYRIVRSTLQLRRMRE